MPKTSAKTGESPPSRARVPRRSSPETRGRRSRRPRAPLPSVSRGHGNASESPSIVARLGLPFARRGPARACAGGRDTARLPASPLPGARNLRAGGRLRLRRRDRDHAARRPLLRASCTAGAVRRPSSSGWSLGAAGAVRGLLLLAATRAGDDAFPDHLGEVRRICTARTVTPVLLLRRRASGRRFLGVFVGLELRLQAGWGLLPVPRGGERVPRASGRVSAKCPSSGTSTSPCLPAPRSRSGSPGSVAASAQVPPVAVVVSGAASALVLAASVARTSGIACAADDRRRAAAPRARR